MKLSELLIRCGEALTGEILDNPTLKENEFCEYSMLFKIVGDEIIVDEVKLNVQKNLSQ